jgi:beta-galactosidase
VVGTSVDAKVAIVFDWDNRWAVKDAQGPRNMGIHYEETVMQHYKAFWELGVPVDIVNSDSDYSKYKLLVAPMLYLTRQETGKRIEAFVAAGGSFVSTYWSGIVDESDLCHLGGFPGPLRKVLGIWSEEIDGLHDHDRNGLVYKEGNTLDLKGEYDAHELCELIHLEGAEMLASYTEDFYAGRPALTVNTFGKGKSYYLATRTKEPFYEDFYGKMIDNLGIKKAVDSNLPAGVTAQVRTDGTHEYVFVLNFSGQTQQLQLDVETYTDMESGMLVNSNLELEVNGVRILRKTV